MSVEAELDYPNIRKMRYCPLCGDDKQLPVPQTWTATGSGLICCWPCFRKHELRYGMSDAVKARLDHIENLVVEALPPTDAFGRGWNDSRSLEDCHSDADPGL